MSRVLIVGAGLTGCTVAWRLAQEGIDCVLLEREGGHLHPRERENVLSYPVAEKPPDRVLNRHDPCSSGAA
jgi:2-polyprenyl-6-methoxyphenol hydroxylase-like FAD-dependent oxidoreductase